MEERKVNRDSEEGPAREHEDGRAGETEATEADKPHAVVSESAEEELEAAEEAEADKPNAVVSAEAEAAVVRGGSGKGWKVSTVVLAVLLAGSLLWQPLANREEAVAVVNGVEIGEQALFDELVKLGGTDVLNNMIAQEAIRQGIEAAGVTASESEVEAEVAEIIESYGSEETFRMTLEQYGYTEEMFREQIETQLQIENIVADGVKVTDDAVAAYFEENKASFDRPEQVRASHILVETKEEAEALLGQLKAGGDFAALASEHSLDSSNKDAGGDLDYFGRGMMEEGFETTAFGLAVGELGIAETSYGFHVVQVTDKQAAVAATLANSSEEIRKQLEDEQLAELTNAWIADQQAKANVVNKLSPAEEPNASNEAASDEPAE